MVLKKLRNKLTKKGNKKGDAGAPTSTSTAPATKNGNNAPLNSMPKTVSEWATSYGSPAAPTSNKSNNADNPDFDKEVDDALAGLLLKKDKPAKPAQSGPSDDNNNTTSVKPTTENSNHHSPSLEQQRRTELQALLKDKSLSKEERKTRMEEVKTNYATLADDQRRKELQALMKDKSITKEDRKLKMEEVKAKYAVFSVKEQQGSASNGSRSGGDGGSKQPQQEAVPTQSNEPKQHHHIDTQHNSYSASYAEDVHGLQGRAVSIAERKNIFENQEAIVAGKVQQYDATPQHKQKRLQAYAKHRTKTSVNVDPTAFALGANYQYGAVRSKKKSTSHEYGGRFM